MSERFPGGIISKTAPVPTGPYENGTAPGIWTLDQQAEFVKQGIWPIAGLTPNYIEDVFSTWLYTGTGAAQTITNGIDLAGEGGLVWFKRRDATGNHNLFDTARGATKKLYSDLTNAEYTDVNSLTSFNANGFSIGVDLSGDTRTYTSWTFRKQEKFFDCVTYTGDGAFSQQINHNLGSTPGFILIKRTNTTGDWAVAARISDGTYAELKLNTTGANLGNFSPSATATSVVVGENWATTSPINASGSSYVMYLFAHNAGGFGLSGEDNVISCGSFTSNGSGLATVNLGYEPQWVLVKGSSAVTNWQIVDNMRGFVAGAGSASSKYLNANSSSAELDSPPYGLTSTGFEYNSAPSTTFIYIAIRRGPMKVPESGTEVFAPVTYTGDGSTTRDLSFGFPVDMFLVNFRNTAAARYLRDRLRGGTVLLNTTGTSAESAAYTVGFDSNTGLNDIPSDWDNASGISCVDWAFRRAPGFMDVCCFTGTGSARTVAHNLTVVPEMMIVKSRGNTGQWVVYNKSLGGGTSPEDYVLLVNSTSAQVGPNVVYWNSTNPSSAEFTVGTNSNVNTSGNTYVAYLFATCPGVSKVGSYTGTGSTLQINCGFTTGARFVLIKRTDSTGDWYVWDSARGIVAGDDPYLLLNSTAAEVTNTDYVDTYSAGFEITSTAPAAINASGGSFIFLAIA